MSDIKDEDNTIESENQADTESAEHINETQESQETQEVYEAKAEDLTGVDAKGPPALQRRKILIYAAIAFAVIVLLGMGFTMAGGNRDRGQAEPVAGFVVGPPRDFLRQEMERSLRYPLLTDADFDTEDPYDFSHLFNEWPLPPPQQVVVQQLPPQHPQPLRQQPQQAGREPQPQFSPLIPRVEGIFIGQVDVPAVTQQRTGPGAPPMSDEELFAMLAGPMQAMQGAMPDLSALAGAMGGMGGMGGMGSPFMHAAQMAQQNREAFANVEISTDFIGGSFLPPNILWIGSIISAVLVNSINSDMPGNVIARVTSNVFDSQTGTTLLIPQGTLLVATYNSSVSHGQSRIQISWDLLIRPDGFMMQLGGMNAVDQRGMAGLQAVYRENWFEYLRAAGIISVFSVINATMANQVGRFGASEEMQLGVLTANQEFIRDIGGNLVSRAMNIQPTLTVEAGTRINIMTNRNMFLPPLERFPVTQRYRLVRN